MESLFSYVAPPSPCGYLPEQTWQLEYEVVSAISPREYLARLHDNWRHFGDLLFRPQCPACTACRSIRVPVQTFCPDRSQRRARKANEGVLELRIGEPSASKAKLRLYDRFHAYQTEAKGWPEHPAKDVESYVTSFVINPVPVEEWCYYLDGRLIGVGYVDVLPEGLSAIYFFYEPDERDRSPGTWNVLSLLDEAQRRGLPYVYLGYHVEGSRSMMYKANFRPNEVRYADGVWRAYRS